MPLLWSDQNRIAQALLDAYPETDRLSLTSSKLLSLIRALPHFAGGTEVPSQRVLDHILWTWMRLADSPAAANDDSKAGDL